jgi:type IV pilus assembly protein PilB
VMFTDTADRWFPPSDVPEADAPVVRLVNMILQEAINLRADRIQMFPESDGVAVRYRIDGEWVDRDRAPLRLLRPMITRLAIMASLDITALFNEGVAAFSLSGVFPFLKQSFQKQSARFRVSVRMESSPGGPITHLDIVAEPPEPPSPAPCP